MTKNQALLLLVLTANVPHAIGDATGINFGSGSGASGDVVLTFDFEDTFDNSAQDLEVEYFTTSGGAGFDCTATAFADPQGDPVQDAPVTVSPFLQTTITNSLEDIVGNAAVSTGTANYCVQVTLCGKTGDDAVTTVDGDCTNEVIVGRSVLEITFDYNLEAVSPIGPINTINVESGTTAFSEEFSVEAFLVSFDDAATDCTASTTSSSVTEAYTGGGSGFEYAVCLVTTDPADASATSITDITSFTLSTGQGSGVTGPLANNCGSSDFCYTTSAITFNDDQVPEGSSLAVTGTVDGTMIIDGRRLTRKLQFEAGDEGMLREPVTFVLSNEARNDDTPFFCDGFLGFLFFWLCWLLDLFD